MKRTGVALTALVLVGAWVAAQVPTGGSGARPGRRGPTSSG
ncbi:hypothetical protein ACQPW3_19455 [Actinosynnema sp. CA-248983]